MSQNESPQRHRFSVPRILDATPEEVFNAWTDPVELASWLTGEGRVLRSALEVDGLLYIEMAFGGRRFPHYGRYLRIEPARLLEFTWVSAGTRGLESVVTVTLAPEDARTRLTLTHSGLPDDADGRSHEEGWGGFLGVLAARLEKRRARA